MVARWAFIQARSPVLTMDQGYTPWTRSADFPCSKLGNGHGKSGVEKSDDIFKAGYLAGRCTTSFARFLPLTYNSGNVFPYQQSTESPFQVGNKGMQMMNTISICFRLAKSHVQSDLVPCSRATTTLQRLLLDKNRFYLTHTHFPTFSPLKRVIFIIIFTSQVNSN